MSSDRSIGGWYFGWNIVAGAAIATLLTVGMRMCIGPFFLPIAGDMGLSRSLLSAIVAVGMLCYGISMPLAGHLVGTRGTRFVLSLGTGMVILAIAWTALARDAVNLLFAFGVLLSLGLSFTSPVAFTPMLSRWFKRQRGMAMFFLSTGSMSGIAIMMPVFAYAIGAVGWRYTLLGFAAVFAALMVPIIGFVIRDDAPAHADMQPASATKPSGQASSPAGLSWRESVRTGPFWKVALGLFTCGYSMNLLGTHGVPMLVDHGFDPMTSSFGLGLIGLVAIFSTLVLGRLADRLPRKNILAAIYLIRGLGFF
ncbi:MAG: MFS transporter, partial [Betaproteobacteria bacterium]|nr:MFS transporter [Betaproteobacteria bacterium]